MTEPEKCPDCGRPISDWKSHDFGCVDTRALCFAASDPSDDGLLDCKSVELDNRNYMIAQLRAWLSERPWDGHEGREARIAVERDENGERFDSLCVFEDGKVLCGFTHEGVLENMSGAGRWVGARATTDEAAKPLVLERVGEWERAT